MVSCLSMIGGGYLVITAYDSALPSMGWVYPVTQRLVNLLRTKSTIAKTSLAST